MMEHTNTPWYRDGDAIYNNPECTGNPIAHALTCAYDNDLNHIDARRIVACVNACEGLASEYLEKVGLPEFAGKMLCADLAQQELDRVTAQRDQLKASLDKIVDKSVELEQQRDQLLAALKLLADAVGANCDADQDEMAVKPAMKRARAAIAAVKGA